MTPFERSRGSWTFPFPGLSLARSPPDDRPTFWTRALGETPEVYGERLREQDDATWRAIDPTRSKLGAALCKGLRELPVPPRGRVLYLGGATGTTASHVADLVGRRGGVYVVEKSPRPFQRLLDVARRWPNLFPILGDAREPRTYLSWVPPVDALYLDISQPEQAEIATDHARLFLRSGGGLVLALKVPSLRKGGGRGPLSPAEEASRSLSRSFDLGPSVSLEPFHRGHFVITGHYRGTGREA
ncbi:MAG: fibrillarin-like rRNA/tRNA 2'-O-methyltransferase [Euryarchaeota archaeon]|nr:fibrillarin-like rRNA/tRNA 2'-O-methyltransferase [Euryarchaeota archaeon]MDE1835952.1 fibrillarin-like rRNA/tRNA 2'-O-methyltransferase [Euryarchaeota archaeon]MDE1880624.1 fibrillarin-like rRNA/tRNA 2'-O-methyltransferase [Euryarchaeota archaeon]MDE2044370.1 fibrillarin-like rRNA/tRNA 2'-O-methyltransferase [Thermoplasmata archaeon]